MQAMQAQQVFLITWRTPTVCTQAMADQAASHYLNDGPSANIAFCVDTFTVAVPVLGYDPRTYQKFRNINAIKYTGPQVYQTSQACYPDFGPVTYIIEPYYQPKQLPIGDRNTTNAHFDIAAPCTWSLPICDSTFWYPKMVAQGPEPVFDVSPSEDPEEAAQNMAKWCAYNLGFVDHIKYCGWVKMDPDLPYKHLECYNWQPPRLFAVPQTTAAAWEVKQRDRILKTGGEGGKDGANRYDGSGEKGGFNADFKGGETVLQGEL